MSCIRLTLKNSKAVRLEDRMRLEVMLKILSKRAFNIGSRRSERYLAFGAPF